MSVTILFIICLIIRLVSLAKSMRNEKKLKAADAVEHGKLNSTVLTLAHVAFYFSCLYEGLDNPINSITFMGLGLFVFSMVMLWWVILSLGDIWTVKLIISKEQIVNHSNLFKYIRHPNYFLNVIPELVAISVICQAWNTLIFGLILYAIPLGIRIWQEEKIMKAEFQDY